jgi:hypothetical protein
MQTIQLPDATDTQLHCYGCLSDTDFRYESDLLKRDSRRTNTAKIMLENENLFRFPLPEDQVLENRTGRITAYLRGLSEYLSTNSPRAKLIRDSLAEFVANGSLVETNGVYSLASEDSATELDYLVMSKFKRALAQDRGQTLEVFEKVLERAPQAQLALFKYDIEALTGKRAYRTINFKYTEKALYPPEDKSRLMITSSLNIVPHTVRLITLPGFTNPLLEVCIGRVSLHTDGPFWFYTNGSVDVIFQRKPTERRRVAIPPTGFCRVHPTIGTYQDVFGKTQVIVNCDPFVDTCEGDVLYEDDKCLVIVA